MVSMACFNTTAIFPDPRHFPSCDAVTGTASQHGPSHSDPHLLDAWLLPQWQVWNRDTCWHSKLPMICICIQKISGKNMKKPLAMLARKNLQCFGRQSATFGSHTFQLKNYEAWNSLFNGKRIYEYFFLLVNFQFLHAMLDYQSQSLPHWNCYKLV